MALLVPVRLLVAVSVAVIVWLPLVFSVALKEPVPLVKVLLAGKLAAAVAAGEVNRAGVTGRRVVVRILRRHREAKGVPASVLLGAPKSKCVEPRRH